MAELVGRMSLPQELSLEAVQRVATRLDGAARTRNRKLTIRRLWVRLAVVLLLGLSLTSLAAGLVCTNDTGSWRPRYSNGHAHEDTAPPCAVGQRGVSPFPLLPPPGPSEQTLPSKATPESSVSHPMQSPGGYRIPRSLPKSHEPSDLSAQLHGELEDLNQALVQLRLEHDPSTALATLSRYRHRYPEGLLASEAALDEVESNLALGRESQALSILDAMHAHGFAGVPRVAEVRVLYGELLVKDGRCGEAVPELDLVVNSHPSTVLRNRAIRQLAACGDPSGE